MLIKNPKSWEISENLATPERIYMGRRAFMGGMAVTGAALVAGCDSGGEAVAQEDNAQEPITTAQVDTPSNNQIYPVARNEAFTLDRDLTDDHVATTYNNFYEFGSHKRIWRAAQDLVVSPWDIVIDGMVEEPRTIQFDDLIRQMPLEERLYRHRCVEAWAMAVPWSGFPLAALVNFARPLSSAKYVRMETFMDPSVANGQRAPGYPFPYVEGLTIEEATNDLAFIATGIYGREMPAQNGAPLRLAVPWKFGFKSIKSLARITFTDERPTTFWEEVGPREYGFWANVNPEVPHRRWSQAFERMIGTDLRIETQLFNGYGEHVAHLYDDLQGEDLYY